VLAQKAHPVLRDLRDPLDLPGPLDLLDLLDPPDRKERQV
jgi:hypothetical protein